MAQEEEVTYEVDQKTVTASAIQMSSIAREFIMGHTPL
jgi:hypothetical protein